MKIILTMFTCGNRPHILPPPFSYLVSYHMNEKTVSSVSTAVCKWSLLICLSCFCTLPAKSCMLKKEKKEKEKKSTVTWFLYWMVYLFLFALLIVKLFLVLLLFLLESTMWISTQHMSADWEGGDGGAASWLVNRRLSELLGHTGGQAVHTSPMPRPQSENAGPINRQPGLCCVIMLHWHWGLLLAGALEAG